MKVIQAELGNDSQSESEELYAQIKAKHLPKRVEEKLIKELADIAWYLAEAATALDADLDDILAGNIEKLRARYPAGFDTEKSIHRTET